MLGDSLVETVRNRSNQPLPSTVPGSGHQALVRIILGLPFRQRVCSRSAQGSLRRAEAQPPVFYLGAGDDVGVVRAWTGGLKLSRSGIDLSGLFKLSIIN